METLGGLAEQTLLTAFLSSLAAALTVTLMTVLELPVSTSQAVVGAIIGGNLLTGTVDFTPYSNSICLGINSYRRPGNLFYLI